MRTSERLAARAGRDLRRARRFRRDLKEGDWPEIDYRDTVLLEEPPSATRASPTPASARILSYGNTEVVIEAHAPPGAAGLSSTTSGIPGGSRRSTASRPKSCAPM